MCSESGSVVKRNLNINECTEKTTCDEKGGVYVGAWAAPTPPHIPVLLSQMTFFQWNHNIR